MEIKKILFPTDFSEESKAAMPMAADLVKKYNAKLYMLHVVYDISESVGWYVPHANLAEMYEDMDKKAKKELHRTCVEELRGYEDIQYDVVRGVPYEEIITYAQEQSIDLLVISTHSRKGLDRLLFGSTAAKVVRYAPCPVLTVRAPSEG